MGFFSFNFPNLKNWLQYTEWDIRKVLSGKYYERKESGKCYRRNSFHCGNTLKIDSLKGSHIKGRIWKEASLPFDPWCRKIDQVIWAGMYLDVHVILQLHQVVPSNDRVHLAKVWDQAFSALGIIRPNEYHLQVYIFQKWNVVFLIVFFEYSLLPSVILPSTVTWTLKINSASYKSILIKKNTFGMLTWISWSWITQHAFINQPSCPTEWNVLTKCHSTKNEVFHYGFLQ